MTKTIDTLIPDIEHLLSNKKALNESNLDLFLSNLKTILQDRFKEEDNSKPRNPLRMSRLGVPNRKFWYESKQPKENKVLPQLKFIYGDLIEQLLLFLAKEAGHKVEDEQKEIIVDGVKGHIDAKIDGYIIDAKSTSDFAFKKFYNGTLAQNDPFGYLAQLSGYAHAYSTDKAGFWAMNKVTGQMALMKLSPIDTVNVPLKIQKQKEILDMSTPPVEKCYPTALHGKSGNKIINKNCSYCDHKFDCWASANNGLGLRPFQYSSEIVYFVEIVNTPRVPELPPNGGND